MGFNRDIGITEWDEENNTVEHPLSKHHYPCQVLRQVDLFRYVNSPFISLINTHSYCYFCSKNRCNDYLNLTLVNNFKPLFYSQVQRTAATVSFSSGTCKVLFKYSNRTYTGERDQARYNSHTHVYLEILDCASFMIWMMQYASWTVLEYSYSLSINRAVFCSCVAFCNKPCMVLF